MNGVSAFRANSLGRRFGNRWALADFSFELAAGESLLLTGPNGSGKTTLLRLLGTATSPSRGDLSVFGHDVRQATEKVRGQVALSSHANCLYEDLTAKENLTLVAGVCGHPQPKQAADTALSRLNVADRAESIVRTLSAGLRRRVALARLGLQAPRLALLDEPFAELDTRAIDDSLRFIRELQAQGTSVVIATHLLEPAKGLCQRTLALAAGRQVAA
ncbi:MAG: heme ABC exporter ATP-binding protein CcmA [Myxococcaceae bacterium]